MREGGLRQPSYMHAFFGHSTYSLPTHMTMLFNNHYCLAVYILYQSFHSVRFLIINRATALLESLLRHAPGLVGHLADRHFEEVLHLIRSVDEDGGGITHWLQMYLRGSSFLGMIHDQSSD